MDQKLIDSYLFNEMSDTEREQFEDSFIGDESIFVEIAERENELVDQYVRNELSRSESERFEQSLVAMPARRQKVTNAKTLHQFLVDERSTKTITIAERNESKTITIAERSTFFSKISELFTFKSPAFQFASIGMIAVLSLAVLFLVLENRRVDSLRADLAAAKQRESELSTQLESERDAAGDLTTDLDAERERIQRLEAEIAKLSTSGTNVRPPANVTSPTIATLLLSPVSVRGGTAPARSLELPPDATRLSIVLNLPAETSERVSLKLNGETVAENRRVSVRKNGEKIVSVTIPTSRIKDNRNEVAVLNGQGDVIETYLFAVSRKK